MMQYVCYFKIKSKYGDWGCSSVVENLPDWVQSPAPQEKKTKNQTKPKAFYQAWCYITILSALGRLR
jgi:hypothetical protein